MTRTMSTVPAARTRWRSILATFALVAALVATTSAMPAAAEVVGTGPGTISGTATSEGQPVGGVSVFVSMGAADGSSFFASAVTDAAGHYELAGLEVGVYDIQAFASGYPQPDWQQAVLTEESPTATVDFVLVPFPVGDGTISGHVTADGVPLPGANVSAYQGMNNGQYLNAVTDENGFYQFTGLATGYWTVFVFAGDQYQPQQQPDVEITDSVPNVTVNHALLSWPVGTAAITGVLTDSATGEPIPFAYISAHSEDAPHGSSTMSDDTGAFSFELLPAGTYRIHYSSWGYLSASQEITVQDDQSANASQALIATNASIIGHVEGPDGTPVVGIYVNAYSAEGNSGWAMTDGNGDYVMSDLGAVEYTLNIGGSGSPYDLQERIVAAEANAAVRADFTLVIRTTGSLFGHLVDVNGEWYSQPVCVTLYSAKSTKPLAQQVTIGEEFGDGTYGFFNLEPGEYTVGFRDCDDHPDTKFDKVFLGGVKNFNDATFVTIVAGQDSYENVVTLTPRGNEKPLE